MLIPHAPAFHLPDALAAVLVAGMLVLLFSLLPEPTRQKFMAIFVGGAGGAYLNGGLGAWEFAFATLLLYLAYRGLTSYTFIGVGWLLHTGWDVVHHVYGTPIVPFVPTSSMQCALCDSLLALWFFYQAPSAYALLRRTLAFRRLPA